MSTRMRWGIGIGCLAVVTCIALACIVGYIIKNGVSLPNTAPVPTALPGNRAAPAPQNGSSSSSATQGTLNKYESALQTSGNDHVDQHNARLYKLEVANIKRDANGVPTTESMHAWLKAAGFTWTSIEREARQPEEETVLLANGNRKKLVSGLQLKAQNLKVRYPGGFTTDRRYTLDNDGRALKIAQDNPSVLVTNGGVSDTLTAYGSVLNWPNLMESDGSLPPPASSNTGCFTIAQLDTKFGIVRSAQGAKNGLLYDGSTLSGAVLKLTAAQESELTALGWTIQGSNPTVKSAWSPESCRPLSQ